MPTNLDASRAGMIIGLDLGTTSLGAVLFDPDRGVAIDSEDRPHDASIDGLPEDRHEQCPERISASACDLVSSLIQRSGVSPERISGLALTGQQHGVVVVDADGKPLTRLITWRDRRAASVSETLRIHDHAERTGCFLHPGYGGLTLHHLVRTGAMPEGACQVLSITGFLASQLTGRCSVDETMAASWGVLDVPSRRWHQPLIEALGIPRDFLPEIVPSCRPLGPVTERRGTGLGPQTLVYSPVGDNQAGFAGVGDLDRGEAVVNLGTSAQLSVHRQDYAFARGLETRPFPGGGFLQVYAALCGGWAYAYLGEFFRKVLEDIGGVRLSLPEVFDRMQAFAASTDAEGLRADTRFAGVRNGAIAAGSLTGIHTSNLTPAHLTRAFANGIAGELAAAATEMGLEGLKGLAVVGNAAHRNPLLVKALEQGFRMPCRLVAAGGEAALGAARLVARLNPSKIL